MIFLENSHCSRYTHLIVSRLRIDDEFSKYHLSFIQRFHLVYVERLHLLQSLLSNHQRHSVRLLERFEICVVVVGGVEWKSGCSLCGKTRSIEYGCLLLTHAIVFGLKIERRQSGFDKFEPIFIFEDDARARSVVTCSSVWITENKLDVADVRLTARPYL